MGLMHDLASMEWYGAQMSKWQTWQRLENPKKCLDHFFEMWVNHHDSWLYHLHLNTGRVGEDKIYGIPEPKPPIADLWIFLKQRNEIGKP